MRQTIYRVDAMDCPCEEQLIRMKLAGIEGIHLMQFDLEKREVTLYHETEEGRITTALDTLRLGSHLLSSTEWSPMRLLAVALVWRGMKRRKKRNEELFGSF